MGTPVLTKRTTGRSKNVKEGAIKSPTFKTESRRKLKFSGGWFGTLTRDVGLHVGSVATILPFSIFVCVCECFGI